MAKQYESVVIVNAALDDDQIEAVLTKIEETVKGNGGNIVEIDKWERKRLAYPVQKSKTGYYAVIRFEAPTELISNLERVYRLDENIIKYLTIALDKKAIEYYEKLAVQKKEEAKNQSAKPQASQEQANEEQIDESRTSEEQTSQLQEDDKIEVDEVPSSEESVKSEEKTTSND